MHVVSSWRPAFGNSELCFFLVSAASVSGSRLPLALTPDSSLLRRKSTLVLGLRMISMTLWRTRCASALVTDLAENTKSDMVPFPLECLHVLQPRLINKAKYRVRTLFLQIAHIPSEA